MPAAIIVLNDADPGPQSCHLPPFPVIGIGRAGHPLEKIVDVLVPDAEMAAALAENCRRHADVAAVLVQLLRLIEDLPPAQALVVESLAFSALQGGADHHGWLDSRKVQPLQPPGTLHVARHDDVLSLVIDRPHARNGVDRAMRDALRDAFDIGALDPDITRITLRALGRTFSTGADLGEFGTTRDPVAAHAIRMQTLPAQALAACGHKLDVHIDGACVGSGLEMAAFAATITATERAWFQLPELGMGLIPGAGGCVSLTRRIGRQQTARLVLSGKRVGARAALEIGLIDRLV